MDQQIKYLRWICAILVLLVICVIIMGIIALHKVERMVIVSEHMSRRVDVAMDAAAPVGKAVVEKGADAINRMDAKDLGEKATNGVKEIGGAAKEKALKWLKSKDEETK